MTAPRDDDKQGGTLFGKLAIAIVLMILGIALFGEKGVVRLVKLMQESEALSQEVEALRRENDRLKHEIQALRNDERYLELLARRELGMVHEDELIYQFRPAKEATDNHGVKVDDER